MLHASALSIVTAPLRTLYVGVTTPPSSPSSPQSMMAGNAEEEAASAMMMMTTTTAPSTAPTSVYDFEFDEPDSKPTTTTQTPSSSKARGTKLKKGGPKRRIRKISRPQHTSNTVSFAGKKAQQTPKKKKTLSLKRKQATAAPSSASTVTATVALRRGRRSRTTRN